MSKRMNMPPLLLAAVLLLLLLTACQGESPASTSEVTASAAQTSVQQTAQQAPEQPSASQPPTASLPTEADANISGTQVPAGCTVVSPQPTPGPTEQSLFPPVNDQDWMQGPKTASITILEYSDFQ